MNGASSVPVTAKPRRLVLHFDINRTIVMRDPTNNINNSTLVVSLSTNFNNISLAIYLPI